LSGRNKEKMKKGSTEEKMKAFKELGMDWR
jgi:hypothetical protein